MCFMHSHYVGFVPSNVLEFETNRTDVVSMEIQVTDSEITIHSFFL